MYKYRRTEKVQLFRVAYAPLALIAVGVVVYAKDLSGNN